jgi:hypothetical protein
MGKRKHLVWVLGLALALGVSNVAFGDNFQKITAAFKPNTKLSKTKFKAGSINVITSTGDTTDEFVSPAVRAKVFFDDDLRFFTKGIKPCRANLEQATTEEARSACRASIVGTGAAEVALAGYQPGDRVPAVITAFAGAPKNGKPVILLQSRVDAIGSSKILVGILKPLPKAGDYGNVLDVAIPPLPGGSAITRFQVRVQKNFTFQGKRRSYVSGRCGDRNKKLNYKGTFFFDDNSDDKPDYSKTAFHAQPCTVR